MATIMFSNLPAEIHVSIASHCKNDALISLCLTSKLLNERCIRVLYRHVDLRFVRKQVGGVRVFDAHRMRLERFCQTLLSHPEYGKYVRILKGRLYIPHFEESHGLGKDTSSEHEWWRAMWLLTNVQSIDVVSRANKPVTTQFSPGLFQSATSVRLVGHMPPGLDKAILNAINPAVLKHLCLDMVQDLKCGRPHVEYLPEQGKGLGRLIALGATSGLLTPLTGRCTALRTLILRRIGQSRDGFNWDVAAEDASYIEWASFIRSVRGTLERFTFEQQSSRAWLGTCSNKLGQVRIMDERFRRLVLPAIVTVANHWPCLTVMRIRGVRDAPGEVALADELMAAVGGNATLVVEEACACRKPYFWDY